MAERSPAEIARETFRLLSVKKLPPTPENYQILYHEVAGTMVPAHFPFERLRLIAAALPAKNPGQQKQCGLLESAITQRSWDGVQNALVGYAGFGMLGIASSGNSGFGESGFGAPASTPARPCSRRNCSQFRPCCW